MSRGVPWPKRVVASNTPFRLTTASGTQLPVQTWPTAYWPDGSVKWTGHAITVSSPQPGSFTLTPLPSSTPADTLPSSTAPAIATSEDADTFIIDTGAVLARISRRASAPNLIESLTIGPRTVAQHGRLIAVREDRPEPNVSREVPLTAVLTQATLEQSGPVRAVVKLEGRHLEPAAPGSPSRARTWLPFTVRLTFFAGSSSITLTHSVIFEGDANKDFIKGLGLRFDLPFAEEPHNRHIRFVGDGGTGLPTRDSPPPPCPTGVWAQPVRMLPGYRPSAGRTIADAYDAHLRGERVPNLADLDPRTRTGLLTVPVWADAKLSKGTESQVLHYGNETDTVVALCERLIEMFGDEAVRWMTDRPITRFPISMDPHTTFKNPVSGNLYGHRAIGGTPFYVCTHSSHPEKVRRLQSWASGLPDPINAAITAGVAAIEQS